MSRISLIFLLFLGLYSSSRCVYKWFYPDCIYRNIDDRSMAINNSCYVVVDGYHGNDGYIDGNIRIFSTRQKAEEFIKKYKEVMKKSKRPGDKFVEYYDNQTIVEIEIE